MNYFVEFIKDLDKIEKNFSDAKMKRFIRSEGKKLWEKTEIKAQELVKKKTGEYYASIKMGKTYIDENGNTKTRVYSNAPHAHLIEDGYLGSLNGREVQVEGKNVFEKARNEFESEHNNAIEKFLKDNGL